MEFKLAPPINPPESDLRLAKLAIAEYLTSEGDSLQSIGLQQLIAETAEASPPDTA